MSNAMDVESPGRFSQGLTGCNEGFVWERAIIKHQPVLGMLKAFSDSKPTRLSFSGDSSNIG